MGRLNYAERSKIAGDWERYCKVIKNDKPTIPQFIAWLYDVAGLSIESRQQLLKAQETVAASVAVQGEPRADQG